jgi:hypothetical protein
VGVSSIVEEEIWGRRRDERDAQVLEEVMAGELHSEVTSEPIRALHDDGAHSVACNAIQHRKQSTRRAGSRLSLAEILSALLLFWRSLAPVR